MKLVYIAGPYGPQSGWDAAAYIVYDEISRNIDRAEEVALRFAEKRIGFICPHLNTRHFEILATAPEDFYKELDIVLLECCQVLYLMPGWNQSKGSIAERDRAMMMGDMWIFEDIDVLEAWYVSTDDDGRRIEDSAVQPEISSGDTDEREADSERATT